MMPEKIETPVIPVDKTFFAELIRDHQLGLRAFVRSLGVKSEWVDDLAQETFVVAYQRMDDYCGDRDFAKWVRGIAFKLVLNERRKNARRKRIMSENLTDIMLDRSDVDEGNLDERFDLNEKIDVMRTCIQKLPTKSQQLLQYRYEADQKSNEVAEKLNMKPDAVRQSLTRLRKRLKDCIEQEMKLKEA